MYRQLLSTPLTIILSVLIMLMMISAKQASFLGLQSQEKKIINVLSKQTEGMTVTDISRRTGEVRTTVHFYLKRLRERNWVKRVKASSHRYPLWYLVEKNIIKQTIFDFLTALHISSVTATTKTAQEGYEAIIDAYNEIMKVGKAERIFVIQGNVAVAAALDKLPTEFIKSAHAIQKTKHIILEGIIGAQAISLFETMSLETLRSHYGRLTIAHLVADKYLDFDAEFFIFRKKVIIVQPKAEKALIILDENISRALRLVFSFVEEHARKFNLNEHIKKLIEQKGGTATHSD